MYNCLHGASITCQPVSDNLIYTRRPGCSYHTNGKLRSPQLCCGRNVYIEHPASVVARTLTTIFVFLSQLKTFLFGQSKRLSCMLVTVITVEAANITLQIDIRTRGHLLCVRFCASAGFWGFPVLYSQVPWTDFSEQFVAWRTSGHECALILTFFTIFVTKNVIWGRFCRTFSCCESCRDFRRTLLWKNRRRYHLFSEHLVLSWCYPPCRMPTASDPAARGNGSVTISVRVSTPVCGTVTHLL